MEGKEAGPPVKRMRDKNGNATALDPETDSIDKLEADTKEVLL